MVEKIAYVLANPVTAGLVERAQDWPGATVKVDELGGGELRAARPTVYFDPDNPQWKAEKTLPLTLPRSEEQDSEKRFREDVAAELQRLEPTEIFRDAKGKSVPPGHYAILLKCVFQSTERTLREDELTTWWSDIIAALTKLGGTIRAPGH